MPGAMLVARVAVVVAAAVGAAGLTWAVTSPAPSTVPLATAGPRAWIDDPVDGAVIARAPDAGAGAGAEVLAVTVVAHAFDRDGIVAVVLSVGGAEIATTTAPGDDLVRVDLPWRPPGPGAYELSVVGRDPDGHATAPGTATVEVTGSDGRAAPSPGSSVAGTPPGTDANGQPTTTTTVEGTPSTSTTVAGETTLPSPTTSSPPDVTTTTAPATSTTACTVAAPTNVSPGDGSNTTDATPDLTWSYSGCAPAGARVQVSRAPDFARIETEMSVVGSTTTATVPAPLAGCVTYYWRVRVERGRTLGPYSVVTSFTVLCRSG